MTQLSPVRAFLLRVCTPEPSQGASYSTITASPLFRDADIARSPTVYIWRALTELMRMLKAFPWRRLPLLCDMICFLLICMMLARTFLYIVKRRCGTVGPSMAPILVQFWAVYGALQFFTRILSLYLAPFNANALISCARAPLLLLLCYGRRLPISTHVYRANLAPFYEANEPEIEHRFQRARATQAELDDAFRELARYLLQRIAVGGLSSLIPIPRFDTPASVSELHISSTPRRRKENATLPQNTAVFPSSRIFFGGESDNRVRTIFEANRENLGGAIQPARVPEMPKAAYDDLRAFRKQMHDRIRKKALGKVAPG